MEKKLPNIVIILVLTTITVIMWIALSIYWAVNAKPNSKVPEDVVKELNPNVDKQAIEKIQQSIFLSKDQVPSIQVNTQESPPATTEAIPQTQ